jgi:hypothetical protein
MSRQPVDSSVLIAGSLANANLITDQGGQPTFQDPTPNDYSSPNVTSVATVMVTTARVTNAQLQALVEKPLTVIKAQGSNTIIVLLGSFIRLETGSSPFASGGPAQLAYNNSQTASINASGFRDPSTINQPITLSNFNAEYAGGVGNEWVLTVLWIVVPST